MKIDFVDKPFPLTQQTQFKEKAVYGTTSAILISICWLMVSDSLIRNIIRERQVNIKHLIILSGTSLRAYWLSHYLCDIVFQAFPSILAIVGIQIFNVDV